LDNNRSNLLRRSDHWPFLQKGVPAVFFHTGLHPDYHTPGDRPERIHYAKMERIVRLVHQASWDLAQQPDRPRLDARASAPGGGPPVTPGAARLGGPNMDTLTSLDENKDIVFIPDMDASPPPGEDILFIADEPAPGGRGARGRWRVAGWVAAAGVAGLAAWVM